MKMLLPISQKRPLLPFPRRARRTAPCCADGACVGEILCPPSGRSSAAALRPRGVSFAVWRSGTERTSARQSPRSYAEAPFTAYETEVLSHGGMSYSAEYHVERYLRESLIPRLAPVSAKMSPNFVGEKVLGLPRSS